jgi:hypothetical protein
MARSKKSLSSISALLIRVKALPSREWMPFAVAFIAIRDKLGSTRRAAHELREGLHGGRLKSAAWQTDGTCWHLEKSFWTDAEIECWPDIAWEDGRHQNAGVRVRHKLEGQWDFFVGRRDLEKLYPTVVRVATPSPERRPDENPSRRKPGPQPRHDWPTRVARELIRRALAGEKTPTAPDILKYCGRELGWEPDIRAMQRLLRELLP